VNDSVLSQRSTLAPLGVLASLAVVVLVYWPTFRDLLTMGGVGEPYSHRVLVFPIFIAGVWAQRHELAGIPPRIFALAIIALAFCGALWLVGELAFIRLFTEAAAVAMVPIVVLAIFGFRWLWAISFPLAYLLFAVPIRGPLVTLQVDLTARFTYAWLLASDIPVHREGPYFELPTGKWSIAAACSGTEYLSACMMLATLYAWTLYSSWRKRVAFILGAIFLGLAGNWLRAYLTILIAHLTDNRFLRNGHGAFGWALFAFLLFIYCAAGWYFREPVTRKEDTPTAERLPISMQAGFPQALASTRVAAMAGVVLLVLCFWPVAAATLTRAKADAIVDIAQIAGAAGWTAVPDPFTDWTPHLVNPARVRLQVFEKDGHRVAVYIGTFADQTWRSKLVTSANDFVDDGSENWTVVERNSATAALGETLFRVNTAAVLGGNGRIAAWQWYWIDGTPLRSDLMAKISQLRLTLMRRADTGAWIAVYTMANGTAEEAANTLGGFTREMGVSLNAALDQTIPR